MIIEPEKNQARRRGEYADKAQGSCQKLLLQKRSFVVLEWGWNP